ncbi:Ig-like domain-containing protein [Candidatus Solincola sp.]|nr:Ig-like domain-containing protein [Actinomycetota bacterium]
MTKRFGIKTWKKATVLLATAALLLSAFFLPPPRQAGADTAYKLITALPSITVGQRISGRFRDTWTSDNSYLQYREQRIIWEFFNARLDIQFNSWQAFSEAPLEKLLDIRVEFEGYQSDTDESWYVQFYDFTAGDWYDFWYFLGSFPTIPDGTLTMSVSDPTLARRFVGPAGAFRLRFADAGTALGTYETTRTRVYFDLIQAAFIYDITPPISSVTAPADMEYTNATTYTVRGISSDPAPDPSGVQLVEVSTDGGSTWYATDPAAPGDYSSWSYQWLIPAEGTYNIRSLASDWVNNLEVPGAGVRVVVDWTPPQVSSVSPLPGSVNVPVDTLVTATFSDANGMLASSINPSTFTLVDEEGTSIPGTVSYDPGTMTATFDPDVDLFYGYTYTATLTTGITDLAGNPLPAPYSWSFRTADILSLTLVETYNRDGTPGGGGVSFGSISPESSPFVIGGGTPPYAARLNVLSSTSWNLFLRADSDLTDASQNPPAVIPISSLQWRLTGPGTWIPFSLTETPVFNPAPGRTPQPGGSNVDLDLLLQLNWEDLPGSYSTTVVCILMVQP